MKYLFEINTTFYKPIYLYIDENTSVDDFVEDIVNNVETIANYTRDDILDVFVQNLSGLMSITRTDVPLKQFMLEYPEYFRQWAGSLERNIHKLYIMDKQYLKTLKNQNEKKKENYDVTHMLKMIIPTIFI